MGTIAIALCVRLVPDKIEKIRALIMISNPFLAILTLVAASALIYTMMSYGEMLSRILHGLRAMEKAKVVFLEENATQVHDVLIVKKKGRVEGFVLFELKGAHVDVLQQPNVALTSAMNARGVSGSMDIFIEGSNDPRILYCIKGRAKKLEALVKDAENKAKAFQSIFETVYEGLVNLQRIRGLDLAQDIAYIRKASKGYVYRVEQTEEGPLPKQHLEKLLKNSHQARAWISIAFEPWKTKGISIDTISLRLKRYKIRRDYRATVKKAGVRVTGSDFLQRQSINTLNADIEKMIHARSLQALYELLEAGVRTGLWRLQVRVAILDEGFDPSHHIGLISAVHASLLSQEPFDELLERQVNIVEARNAAKELESMILRRVNRKRIIATSSDLAYFLQPQSFGKVYLTPNVPTPRILVQKQEAIVIGRALTASEKPSHDFALSLASLRKHTVILGATGSGKSTTAKILAHELSQRRMPTLILDWTGEFREILPKTTDNIAILVPGSNFTLNLFDGTKNIGEDSLDWVDTLDYYAQTSWGAPLTPLQRRILIQTLDEIAQKKQLITFTQLLNELKSFEKQVLHRTDWTQSIEALISRLQPLTQGISGQVFDQSRTTLNLGTIFEPITTIVDLSILRGDEAKTLLSQLFCKKIYDQVRREAHHVDETRLVLIVDEAQHLAPQLTNLETTATLGILERYALELRKYGIGIVTIASRPALLSKNIIANANTLICHKLYWQEDVDRVAETLGLVDPNTWRHCEAYKQCLRTLAPGQAIVKLDHHAAKFAFMVEIGLPRHRDLIRCHDAPDAETQTKDSFQERKEAMPVPVMSAIIELALLRLSMNLTMPRKELGLSRRQAQELVDRGMVSRDRYDSLRITEEGRRVAEAITNRK